MLEGKFDEASEYLEATFPDLHYHNRKIAVAIDCLKVIELIRNGMVLEAVAFSQERLSKFSNMTIPARLRNGKETEILVDRVIALVAYMEPSESELAFLLDPSQREVTFDLINNTLLCMCLLISQHSYDMPSPATKKSSTC